MTLDTISTVPLPLMECTAVVEEEVVVWMISSGHSWHNKVVVEVDSVEVEVVLGMMMITIITDIIMGVEVVAVDLVDSTLDKIEETLNSQIIDDTRVSRTSNNKFQPS